MGKIKKLFMSALACVGVLGCAAVVGSKVEAAGTDYSNNGSTYVVSNNNKTATWDFTTTTNGSSITMNVGDTVHGIIAMKTQVSLKSDTRSLCLKSGVIYIPVPAESSGTLKLTNGTTDKKRTIGIGKLVDDVFTYTEGKSGYSSCSLSFTSDDLVSYENGTYLPFGTNVASDNKIKIYEVTLTSGEFAASKAVYDVDIKDGDTLLSSTKVTEGNKLEYVPAKWGYNFAGYSTHSDLSDDFDYKNTEITSSIVLYVKWTAWEDGVDEFAIKSTQLQNMDGFSCTTETKLAGTIYSLLPSCQIANGYISTGGGVATNQKGVKIEVPTDGVITVSTTVGGNSARNAKLIDSSKKEIEISTGDKAFDGSSYEARTITYNVSAGTYYLGGDNSMRIFSISFEEPTPVVETVKLNYQFDNDTEKNAVRFIGTINAEDLAKVSEIKLELTLSDGVNSETVTVSFDTVYTSISDLAGFGEVEGVYYIILELTDLSFARGYTLNGTLKVTIDGVEGTATLAEAISLAVAE